MSDIPAKLQEVLAEFLPEGQQMIDTKTPIASLGIESVGVMEFVLEVEDIYDISIDLESLANIQTLDDLAAVVARETE